jgi:NADH:ubiquinone oxidoreductase subunit F (NADH-binding)
MTMTASEEAGSRTSRAPIGLQRLFVAGDATLSSHLAAYGPLAIARIGRELIDSLEAAGLTGRGGAGFASWRKIAATAKASQTRSFGGRPIVIGNGAEGEPLSLKDAFLLRHSPHLVIDGLLATASALGATETYLYVGRESLDSVATALGERPDARRVNLVEAPKSFISGEASAVVNAIENGVALPTDRIRRLSEFGLRGRPTLLQNVETLAQIALIARFGPAWFRSVGTPEDPGSRLVTVSGDVPMQGVLEAAGGTTIRAIVQACGAEPSGLSAVLLGGYHSAWTSAQNLELPLSPESLSSVGATPGSGIILALGAQRCGLARTATIIEYLAQQSARQCGPCMFGLPVMAKLFGALAAGSRDPGLITELRRIADAVVGRGACHHPDGTSRLVLSALSVFRGEVEAHLAGHCTERDWPTT